MSDVYYSAGEPSQRSATAYRSDSTRVGLAVISPLEGITSGGRADRFTDLALYP
ncbi:hypothetical protein [Actinoplanes xinjiangensis]|uniref:hypothetical protein n=1 Tax=Actinoplanes xinjiangensis TaxID=512350 RepID=UPI00130E19C9|nr:hypothetical protein [Actinoplanes xinjiangensis]